MSPWKPLAVIAGALTTTGLLGAGCLSRPVTNASPVTNTNFTAVVHNESVDKVDLLFMIDNSASMGDKQNLLAQAVPIMITRLVSPNCLDANGNPDGTQASPDGTCSNATSKAEFPPVHDMHIGIVSSSLGGRGGDQCSPTATNPANAALNAHNDDRGELLDRGGVAGDPTIENVPAPDLTSDNFLAWFPSVSANTGKTPPSPPISNPTTLISDFSTLIEGVHEHGCGFEAQDEAWYRFLVQPDPYDQIVRSGNTASFQGVDKIILQERSDFLRPDSLVAVIVVTDENDSVADPLAIGGQGWAFDNGSFPGSTNGSAPEGTIECQNLDPNNPSTTGPNDPNCETCAFKKTTDSDFATRCPTDGTNGNGGYLSATDDQLNPRFYHQHFRFGVDVGYPTSRYIRGLQKATVPDSQHEHDGNGNYIGDQDANANCVNPLYAQNLPTDPTAELCALTKGTRTADLIYYAAISGVPHQLLQEDPTNPDSPQKDTLTDADWTLITGQDPEHFDFRGADFHMVEDFNPRTGQYVSTPSQTTKSPWQAQGVLSNLSSCPPGPTGAGPGTSCDPINGGEWNTGLDDLQYACIFDLRPQYQGVGKDCTDPKYSGACDCAANEIDSKAQLCDTTTPTLQIYGKAYPCIHEMLIAKAMSQSTAGNQGIVSSLCPIHVSPASGQTAATDPLYGYNPAVNAIVNRLKASLSNQCLPQRLQPDSSQNVPCLILVQLPGQVGPGACANPGGACDQTKGLLGPGVVPAGANSPTLTQDVLNKYCASLEAAGGYTAGQPGDPDLQPVCALQQLNPVSNAGDFANNSCAASTDPGWCYVTGTAANGCPQAILFSNGQPPTGATVSLQCIESAVSVVGDGGSGGTSSSGSSGSSGGGSSDASTAGE
ncbi:MAG TPA: hypothetical protein VGG39_13950 [Polyangiaceae bacterium]|jgi:hypothetical protein